MYDIDRWWNEHFSTMEADSQQELQEKFSNKLIELYLHDYKIFKKEQINQELEAWHISNEKLPDHLEMTDEEFRNAYGGGE